jgi:hypothetical protein
MESTTINIPRSLMRKLKSQVTDEKSFTDVIKEKYRWTDRVPVFKLESDGSYTMPFNDGLKVSKDEYQLYSALNDHCIRIIHASKRNQWQK